MKMELLSKNTMQEIFQALGSSKKHDVIWKVVDEAKTEDEIIHKLTDLQYNEKADLIIKYVKQSKTEPWVTIQIMDKNHLEKTYQLIKNNPQITQEELVEKLNLEII